MTSIYSAITGQFGKIWVLGALLPSLAAVILWQLFVDPLLPQGGLIFRFPSLSPDLSDSLSNLFAAIILSGLLYNLNNTIIRWYEGYYWSETWIGRWRGNIYKQKLRVAKAHWLGMRTFARFIQNMESCKKSFRETMTIRRLAGTDLYKLFPDREDLVLPTRLGNIIRSTERYPFVMYEMDAIALWPRLVGVIDKEYAAAIDDSKINLDFTLNSSFLSFCLGVSILLASVRLLPNAFQNPETLIFQLLLAILFLALSWLFYVFSLENASSWGEMIRGAFDLYRFDLLMQLGYDNNPATRAEEKAMWRVINQELLFIPDPYAQSLAYSHDSTHKLFVETIPPNSPVVISRGAAALDGNQPGQVSIRIHNQGENLITRLVVVDTVEDGLIYVQGTAGMPDHMVLVEGRNPYRFTISGGFAKDEARELCYQVTAWPKKISDKKETENV